MCFLLLLCVCCRNSVPGFVTDFKFRFDILSWKNLLTFKNLSGCLSLLSINVFGLLRESKQIQVKENLKPWNFIYLCKQNNMEGKWSS